MIDKINTRKFERKKESVSNSIPSLQLSNHQHYSTESNKADDLIKSLANAHENIRARQVIKWQRVQSLLT